MRVVINNSEINSVLATRLKESDIKIASDLCTKGSLRNRLNFDIMCRTGCNNCVNKCSKGVVIPEGNVNADVMFICEQPTEIDGKTNTVMFDAQGRIFTVIIDKLGIKRDNIYISPVIKCSTKAEDTEDLALMCASSFLLREISLVQPKKIIAMGTTATNIVRTLLGGLDAVNEVLSVRGEVFRGYLDDLEFDVLQTISTDFLLTKSGSMYEKYKMDIWKDISSFYKK